MTETATLSIDEAAALAGRSERTIRNWLGRGRVAFVRDDEGRRRVVRPSLEAYLASIRVVPAPPAPAVAGLPELVAEVAAMRKALEDAQWRVGYLTAELEAAKRLALPAPAQEPEAQGDVASPPDAPGGLWRRVRGWFG